MGDVRERVLDSPVVHKLETVPGNFSGVISFKNEQTNLVYDLHYLFGFLTSINCEGREGMDVLVELLDAPSENVTVLPDDLNQVMPTSANDLFNDEFSTLLETVVTTLEKRYETPILTPFDEEEDNVESFIEEVELPVFKPESLVVEEEAIVQEEVLEEEALEEEALEGEEGEIEEILPVVPLVEALDINEMDVEEEINVEVNDYNIRSYWEVIEFTYDNTLPVITDQEFDIWNGLKPSFIDVERFLNTLMNDRFTGYVTVDSDNCNGKIWFYAGQLALLVLDSKYRFNNRNPVEVISQMITEDDNALLHTTYSVNIPSFNDIIKTV